MKKARSLLINSNINTNANTEEHLPSHEGARLAVEKARKIVKLNNEMVLKLKEDSCIPLSSEEDDPFVQYESLSYEKTYTFHSNKIKSQLGMSDFIKDLFGVH